LEIVSGTPTDLPPVVERNNRRNQFDIFHL
jgi:hypothetical protein